MLNEEKPIIRIGDSWGVTLTKFFKKMGLSLGDDVMIFFDNDEIIITKEKNIKFLPAIERELWDKFLSVIIENEGYDNLNKSNIKKCLEEAVTDWIKKKTSWWKKPIF